MCFAVCPLRCNLVPDLERPNARNCQCRQWKLHNKNRGRAGVSDQSHRFATNTPAGMDTAYGRATCLHLDPVLSPVCAVVVVVLINSPERPVLFVSGVECGGDFRNHSGQSVGIHPAFMFVCMYLEPWKVPSSPCLGYQVQMTSMEDAMKEEPVHSFQVRLLQVRMWIWAYLGRSRSSFQVLLPGSGSLRPPLPSAKPHHLQVPPYLSQRQNGDGRNGH
ncbi:uncharacterized protein B0H64DRAFT_178250 [Chaetomium fimeti]|uniref:Uncharacterized protein n=1 Tax=Chaetomium fimeti TaxID=1854472 RepID=A0AAE0HCV6_9PEZI|nr:hypothetical protein B0H64DRAFT_178250 [Chaetomium fimeti]